MWIAGVVIIVGTQSPWSLRRAKRVAANPDAYNPGLPQNRDPEKAALLHEVTEALTALGNYLDVAHRKFKDQPEPRQEDLGEALKKSLGQYERAAEAVRRLSDIFRREAARNNNPGGIR
jgi:hypothetical protein